MLYPLRFVPVFKERVWGGRTLEQRYRKPLPAAVPIGESWEVSDRPGDESVIANGPLAGQTLRWLMQHHRAALLGGAAASAGDRFPLLCKILDARDTLSVQVHPPSAQAARLGGEPKTEMWYIADAAPGAELHAGLKRGVDSRAFQHALEAGTVAECLHRVAVTRGDVMFLPSGRVHAIGAGLLIFEIQQNSDTTYRVFDWNRVGLDGRPRELHIADSLASIDFTDVEPGLATAPPSVRGRFTQRTVVRDPLFSVGVYGTTSGSALSISQPALRIVAVAEGELTVNGGGESLRLGAGDFGVIPASLADVVIDADAASEFLLVQAGGESGAGS